MRFFLKFFFLYRSRLILVPVLMTARGNWRRGRSAALHELESLDAIVSVVVLIVFLLQL